MTESIEQQWTAMISARSLFSCQRGMYAYSPWEFPGWTEIKYMVIAFPLWPSTDERSKIALAAEKELLIRAIPRSRLVPRILCWTSPLIMPPQWGGKQQDGHQFWPLPPFWQGSNLRRLDPAWPRGGFSVPMFLWRRVWAWESEQIIKLKSRLGFIRSLRVSNQQTKIPWLHLSDRLKYPIRRLENLGFRYQIVKLVQSGKPVMFDFCYQITKAGFSGSLRDSPLTWRCS